MKLIAALPIIVLFTGCCSTNPDIVEYQQVVVTPSCCNQVTVAPCCRHAPAASCCNRVRQVTIINTEEPIDVTTTNLDYY